VGPPREMSRLEEIVMDSVDLIATLGIVGSMPR
jgi:hypothetical protein